MNARLCRPPLLFAALLAASAIPAALADSALGHGLERAVEAHRIALGGVGRFRIEAAAATLYAATQDARNAERHWQMALEAATSPAQRMFALHMRGESQLIAGEYDEGIATGQALLDLAGKHQHTGYRAQAHGLLGRIARRRGELQQAYAHQQESLHIARAGDRPADAAQALVNLGTVLRDMGRFSEAMDQQLQALEIRRKLGPGNRVDVPYRNIGLLYREIEDTQSAREFLEKALAAAREEFDPAALSSALGSFATLLNDAGEPAQALDNARRAMAIDSRMGDRQGIALERLEVARALIALGQRNEAEVELDAALRLGESMHQADVIGRALLYRGDLRFAQGRLSEAEAAYGGSLDHLTRAQLKPQLNAAYKAMEELLERRGELREALAYARRRAGLREELLGVTAARRLAVLELKQQRERTERQVELLRLDNSLKELNLRTETLRRRIGAGFIAMLLALLGLVFWRWREAHRLARLLARKNAEISEQDAALREANARLTEKSRALFVAATTDPLTALANRGHVMQLVNALFDRHQAQGVPLSLMLIDLDRFKAVNDSMGHQFGDRVLIAAAQVLSEEMHTGDPLGRYGGEEFIAALPGASAVDALATAERLRLAVQRRMGMIDGHAVELTASIGIAELHEIGANSSGALIAAADQALYRAKDLGRNRVEIARTASVRHRPT